MVYAASCPKHGNYLGSCQVCAKQEPLHRLTRLIQSGVSPEKALETVLEQEDKAFNEAKHREGLRQLEETSLEIARANWIRDNMPSDLKNMRRFG